MNLKSSSAITSDEKLNLDKLIRETNATDNTDYIRRIKHSPLISKDILTMNKLKNDTIQWRFDDPDRFLELCRRSCNFLFTHYTDIFNRLIKDEINMEIMKKILYHLNMIETGQSSQHGETVLVGRLLKDLFLDSAIRRSNNLNKILEDSDSDQLVVEEPKSISWAEYKKQKQQQTL